MNFDAMGSRFCDNFIWKAWFALPTTCIFKLLSVNDDRLTMITDFIFSAISGMMGLLLNMGIVLFDSVVCSYLLFVYL